MRWKRRVELLIGVAAVGLVYAAPAARTPHARDAGALRLAGARRSADDLEVSGRVAGLPVGGVGYVSREQLLGLPQVSAAVSDDPDLGGTTVHVRGVKLSVLEHAVGVEPGVDLLDTPCSDGYRSYFPAEMIRAHDPILALTIEGLTPSAWAAKAKQDDPGPYLVVYDGFRPAWSVLAHQDRPQLPTNVVRVGFGTKAQAFAEMRPRGGSAAEQGYRIARQNCIRCHAAGSTGGAKSQKTWRDLAGDARGRPGWFARMVKEPKAVNATSTMVPNPEYDETTLRALVEYFRTQGRGETR